jgi:hypothetical protein
VPVDFLDYPGRCRGQVPPQRLPTAASSIALIVVNGTITGERLADTADRQSVIYTSRSREASTPAEPTVSS